MSRENVDLIKSLIPRDADLVQVFGAEDPVQAFIGDTAAVAPDLEVEFAPPAAGGRGRGRGLLPSDH